ncbi:MAG: right-handed parallel beta-helix repeat-containing protein, partial [Pseudomonadota bacterium]
ANTTVYVDDADCAGLTPCFNTIQEGVNNAGGGPATVFIFPGNYDESVDISLMGSNSGGAADLTLQATSSDGSPSTSGAAILSSNGEAIFNSVDPFPASLTLIGIRVSSATTDAIDIEGLTGNVDFSTVRATNAFYDGIDLRISGGVTMRDVTASNNGTDGIEIRTEGTGDIRLRDVEANGNGITQPDDGDGIVLFVRDGEINLINVDASNNFDDGIRMAPFTIETAPDRYTFGTIRSVNALRITANGNGVRDPEEPAGKGFRLRSDLDDLNAWGRVGTITIRESESSNNSSGGFELEGPSSGNVVISDTIASGNGREGFEINPSDGYDEGEPSLDSVHVIPLVSLTRVRAFDNGADGFQIEPRNKREPLAIAWIEQMVFTDVVARNNGNRVPADGIELGASDRIQLTRVASIGNSTDGLQIAEDPDDEAKAAGRARGVPQEFVGTDLLLIGNGRDNLELDTFGNATIRDIIASGSVGDEDDDEPNASYDGIEVITWGGGNILIESCEASNNASGDGLDLTTGAGGSITVRDCRVSGNSGDGIDVSKNNDEAPFGFDTNTNQNDSILIEDVIVEGNGDDGCQPFALGPVTINRACIRNNDSSGLLVMGGTTLTVTDSLATNNATDGMCLRDLTGGTHTISGSDISGNGAGLVSATDSTITATGLFWGAGSGPTHPNNGGGSGDTVVDSVNAGLGTVTYTPFAAASVTANAACEAEVGPDISNALPPRLPIDEAPTIPSTGLTGRSLLVLLLLLTAGWLLSRRHP